MSLYDEYEQYVLQYQKEYGKKCVVLYRCGQFYEIYSVDDGLIDIKSIGELLNIQVSRRNKSILEVNRSNTLMAGFPMFALQKFISILIDANFTVVIVDQISPPPKPKRAVTEIISPGTVLNTNEYTESKYLTSIFIEEHTKWRSHLKQYAIGISMIDMNTGKSKLTEYVSKDNDTLYPFDEVYRVLSTHPPKEIIISGTVHDMSIDQIYKHLQIDTCNNAILNKINIFPPDICNINYQNILLSKVFTKCGMLTPIEFLHLERYNIACTSFVYLLQFANKHNELLLHKVHIPEIISPSNALILQYNAAKQLNIISNGNEYSLLTILNTCHTAIGKRTYKDLLLNPITSVIELEKRYDAIDFMYDKFEYVGKLLDKTYDIERLFRKMVLHKFHPADFTQLDTTLVTLQEILQIHNIDNIIDNKLQIFDIISHMQDMYTNILDITEVPKYHLDNIDKSFFKVGVYN